MQTEISDLTLMQRPELWPCWPLLPIKRHVGDGPPECAVLCETPLFAGVKPVVYLSNLYDLTKLPNRHVRNLYDLTIDLANFEKIEYASFETLVADGWIVD